MRESLVEGSYTVCRGKYCDSKNNFFFKVNFEISGPLMHTSHVFPLYTRRVWTKISIKIISNWFSSKTHDCSTRVYQVWKWQNISWNSFGGERRGELHEIVASEITCNVSFNSHHDSSTRIRGSRPTINNRSHKYSMRVGSRLRVIYWNVDIRSRGWLKLVENLVGLCQPCSSSSHREASSINKSLLLAGRKPMKVLLVASIRATTSRQF